MTSPLESGATARVKPTHYKVICISMYTKDLELADVMIAELKARGYTKANRSMVIRLAMAHLDLDAALKTNTVPL